MYIFFQSKMTSIFHQKSLRDWFQRWTLLSKLLWWYPKVDCYLNSDKILLFQVSFREIYISCLQLYILLFYIQSKVVNTFLVYKKWCRNYFNILGFANTLKPYASSWVISKRLVYLDGAWTTWRSSSERALFIIPRKWLCTSKLIECREFFPKVSSC